MDNGDNADNSAAALAEREARIHERRERIRQREYAKNNPEQVELVEGEFKTKYKLSKPVFFQSQTHSPKTNK